jgi:hypothetical protein
MTDEIITPSQIMLNREARGQSKKDENTVPTKDNNNNNN